MLLLGVFSEVAPMVEALVVVGKPGKRHGQTAIREQVRNEMF